VSPSSTNWANGQFVKRATSSYAQISGSPFSLSSAPFNSLPIAAPPLTANTTYYARVQYATTNTQTATSDFSSWSSFTTGSLPAPGSSWTYVSTGQGAGSSVIATGGAYGSEFVIGYSSTSNNQFIRSTDGTTWQGITAPALAANPTAVGYGNSIYVAGGSNVTPVYSNDGGLTWTLCSATNYPNPLTPLVMEYGNGLWVAAGGTQVVTNPDPTGVAWTARTSNYAGTSINAGIYGGGKWVLVGDSGNIITSGDGITWASQAALPQTLRCIAYGNGTYVTAGSNGLIRYSSDGSTWSAPVSSGFSGGQTIYDVAYGNGGWIAVGVDSSNNAKVTYTTSPSGTWTAATLSGFTPSEWATVATFGNGRFVLNGIGNTSAYAV
jgi:hypothetical protein